MKKWRRRILLVLLLIVAAMALFSGSGYWLAQATPEWYRPLKLTDEERLALEARAEDMFFLAQNWANEAHTGARAGLANTSQPATTASATRKPVEPLTISFSEAELNAAFQKWAGANKARIEQYLKDPVVAIKDQRLVIGGTVPDLKLIASIHFEPSIDDDGQLRMRTARVMGGRLPLPEAILNKYKAQAVTALESRLPALQRGAQIGTDGSANEEAVKAAAARFVLQVLKHEPSDAVLFLPTVGGTIPVRMTDLTVADEAVSLTVQPMTSAERADLLARIRNEEPSARASTD